jgi:hypothetical protein
VTAERKYTLREALHLLADVLADSIPPSGAANDGETVERDTKPDNAPKKREKRPRVPRRSAQGAAVLASEIDKATAERELRNMGVRLPK